MRPSRRRLLAALGGLGLLAACGADAPPATPLPPLTLPADSPLVSLGGLLLNRKAMGFGGLSGLHIDPDLTLTAVSDLGRWLQARLVLDEAGQPQGLEALRSGRLSDGLPIPLPGKLSRDAESLARLPDGTWLVGFERWHRIRAYDRIDGWGEPVEMLPGLRQAPLNGGLESLTVLADGRWLAVAEDLRLGDGGRLRRVWVGRPGDWTVLSYRPTPGYVPTDAAALPDGGAVLTERSFSLLGGFQGQLKRVPAAALANPAPDAVLEPEVLLDAATLPMENWEDVASFSWRGRQFLALMTDDNEFFLQKGLLLLFAFR
ncbi:esterase-like activity of phytase family protein [Pseudoroseomonas wenyumeiae]|uniref:Esterase-like activity of phytase family protein n=1 Tax=Teichococcus wenyumeiae TaxID=2478470 RepID=A0A3A9JIH5_9PROT|nr:esterase-like activity of phytase family protein [Pseudoroseomonas wenyumeiae]RKK04573.1 esterase-like activity of phytase family protein [Pseudoroseomonas wenyumeiae]RMI20869.1 esterase-like activity of phytase family protein [Pseudoroseomonas wenyumeiae]